MFRGREHYSTDALCHVKHCINQALVDRVSRRTVEHSCALFHEN